MQGNRGRGGQGRVEDESDMVKEVECVQNLGRSKMFSCIRVSILGCVVKMVLIEVVVLVRVVEVMCLGAYFLSGVEVECLRVGF